MIDTEVFDCSRLETILTNTHSESYETLIQQLLDESSFEDYTERIDEDHLKSGLSFKQMLDKTNDRYSVVAAFTGDDEIVGSTAYILGYAMLYINENLLDLKVSWKDTGISHWMGNYAEEWILTPLTRLISFDPVNAYFKGSAVPYSLDTIKLRMLTPVRKQSEMERDLTSKMKYLTETARWTEKSWFTYDFHQLTLLLATVVFDYENATTFPFLTETEGGSGGAPPWGNIPTLWSFIHYYNRGKSKKSIIGILKESSLIMQGSLKPANAFFTKAVHIATSGDRAWKQYTTAHETVKRLGNLGTIEVQDLIRSVSATEIEPELVQKGIVIQPEDYTVGVALSKLRQDGHIMTEIDVKMYEQALVKEQALTGTTPMKDVLAKIEDENKIFKSRAFKLLNDLYIKSDEIKDYVDNYINIIPHKFDDEFIEYALKYYKLRLEHIKDPTSFIYTSEVRIFKTKDVMNYYNVTSQKTFVKELVSDSFEFNRPTDWQYAKFPINEDELENEEAIKEWLSNPSKEQNLLRQPLPIGLGTDDARIVRNISIYLEEIKDTSVEEAVVLIITNDYELVRTIRQYASRMKLPYFISIIQLKLLDYVNLCWQIQQRISEPSDIEIYNYIVDSNSYIPKNSLNNLLKECSVRAKIKFLSIQYDTANIERGLFRYKASGSDIKVISGGMIPARYMQLKKEQGLNPSTEPLTRFRNNSLLKENYKPVRLQSANPRFYGLNRNLLHGYRPLPQPNTDYDDN